MNQTRILYLAFSMALALFLMALVHQWGNEDQKIRDKPMVQL